MDFYQHCHSSLCWSPGNGTSPMNFVWLSCSGVLPLSMSLEIPLEEYVPTYNWPYSLF